MQIDIVLTKYKKAEGWELKRNLRAVGTIRRDGRWWALPGIGAPGPGNDKGHVFINNVGEDNRRRSSMCRRHTWEDYEDRTRT